MVTVALFLSEFQMIDMEVKEQVKRISSIVEWNNFDIIFSCLHRLFI